jgi:hypothetical protein
MKKFLAIALTIITMSQLAGCASCERGWVDFKSDVGGGLNRTINVYTANGDLIAQYTGKIDLEMSEGGYVKFDLNGKRYIYYNCFVESIADIY